MLGLLLFKKIRIILGVAKFTISLIIYSLFKLDFYYAIFSSSNLFKLKNICHLSNHVSSIKLTKSHIILLNLIKFVCQSCFAIIVKNNS